MADSLKDGVSYSMAERKGDDHTSVDPTPLADVHAADAQALQGQDLHYTAEEERRVVRRMDLILLPLMALGSGFQLVDKSGLGAAATLTLNKDLNLVGSDYSWAVTIYYFGLLLGTYPSNLILQRYHVGRFTGVAFVLWSATMFGMIGVTNFGGLAACRFLLGLLESPMAPAFTTTTARFYTQKEQPLRFALWTLANTILPIPFLLIYYGFGTIANPALQNWRYIFVLLGACTVVIGGFLFIYLPDRPGQTWWLNERQRAIAVARIAKSQVGTKETHFKKEQVWEAITDPKAWMIVLMMMTQQTGVSLFSNFSGLVIKGFGYTQLKALLLQIPAWAVATITVITIGSLASRTRFWRNRKTWLLAGVTCVVVASGAVLYTTPTGVNENRVLLTVFITLLNAVGSGYGQILGLIGQNITGATKRQTVISMVFLGYCVSNICLPQAFLSREAPRYQTGILTVLICQVVLLATYLTFYFVTAAENRRRDKLTTLAEDVPTAEILMATGLQDLTDKQNRYFRYSG